MRIIVSLLLVCSCPLTAETSEKAALLVGYIEFPTGTDYWADTSGEKLMAETLLLPTQIELFTQPQEGFTPSAVMPDLYELKSTSFAFSTALSINVYEKRPGWLRVKTMDNQLFWMKHEMTAKYISLPDVFLASWYLEFDTTNKLRIEPTRHAPEIDRQNLDPERSSYALRGNQLENGELWLKLEIEAYDQWSESGQDRAKQGISTPIGWLKAHDKKGELVFRFVSPC